MQNLQSVQSVQSLQICMMMKRIKDLEAMERDFLAMKRDYEELHLVHERTLRDLVNQRDLTEWFKFKFTTQQILNEDLEAESRSLEKEVDAQKAITRYHSDAHMAISDFYCYSPSDTSVQTTEFPFLKLGQQAQVQKDRELAHELETRQVQEQKDRVLAHELESQVQKDRVLAHELESQVQKDLALAQALEFEYHNQGCSDGKSGSK